MSLLWCLIYLFLPSTHSDTIGGGTNADLLSFVEDSEPFANTGGAPISKLGWVGLHHFANTMGAKPVPQTIYVPIYVNLFTIGLDGTGNQKVTISKESHAWLEHLDHVVKEHVVSDAENQYNEKSDTATKGSDIVYRYHFRLVDVSPHVLDVLEMTLNANHRPDNSRHPQGLVQVNAEAVSELLEDLAKHLELDDAYNIFVLNPKKTWQTDAADGVNFQYGYRAGFSTAEIHSIQSEDQVKKEIDQFVNNREAVEKMFDVSYSAKRSSVETKKFDIHAPDLKVRSVKPSDRKAVLHLRTTTIQRQTDR